MGTSGQEIVPTLDGALARTYARSAEQAELALVLRLCAMNIAEQRPFILPEPARYVPREPRPKQYRKTNYPKCARCGVTRTGRRIIGDMCNRCRKSAEYAQRRENNPAYGFGQPPIHVPPIQDR